MPSFREYLDRKRREFGSKFDPINLSRRFVPYFESGERISVKFSWGEVKRGTVSVTSGWKPHFMLMLRRSDLGSSWLLDLREQIVPHVPKRRLKKPRMLFNPMSVKIKRVGGAQAQMALKDLGHVKVDVASAERLFNAGVPFIIAPAKVNSHHFFSGWGLAIRVDPARYHAEGWTFKRFLNNWRYYNENSETGKAAFFVSKAAQLIYGSGKRRAQPRMMFNE